MEPSKKSPEMDEFLQKVFGFDRRKCILEDKCVFCGQSAIEFRDQKSIDEYKINGVCQRCQDEVYGE